MQRCTLAGEIITIKGKYTENLLYLPLAYDTIPHLKQVFVPGKQTRVDDGTLYLSVIYLEDIDLTFPDPDGETIWVSRKFDPCSSTTYIELLWDCLPGDSPTEAMISSVLKATPWHFLRREHDGSDRINKDSFGGFSKQTVQAIDRLDFLDGGRMDRFSDS